MAWYFLMVGGNCHSRTVLKDSYNHYGVRRWVITGKFEGDQTSHKEAAVGSSSSVCLSGGLRLLASAAGIRRGFVEDDSAFDSDLVGTEFAEFNSRQRVDDVREVEYVGVLKARVDHFTQARASATSVCLSASVTGRQ
ncbi:uncharacterized protein AB675_11833 [Cyphellophora attinorum]|uniref:Uncharacterized protein n=1 Tax=Cyphellophora attinorum TaxID=1664694 RepID=A0A0N1NY98_9EURO|nr:uncharacterized protein AB675_11833 [Phialophora attinorum]KPI36794.1 hypothetical protein AB675_11833 [Phialophora attinorum]